MNTTKFTWGKGFKANMFLRDFRAIFPAIAFACGIVFVFQILPWLAPKLSFKTIGPVAFVLLVLFFTRVQTRLGYGIKFALIFALFGILVAMYRVNTIDTNPISFRYYGNVAGQIVKIDKSASDAPRLTLEKVRLDNAPQITKIRLSLHGSYRDTDLEIGNYIYTTANISPISGPVEPGGYDFRAALWFLGIEAVGYTRHPILLAPSPNFRENFEVKLNRLRNEIAQALIGEIGVRNGGFAAAILVGDRGALDSEVVETMRRANLAHLIAISGLHLAIVMGLVFSSVQRVTLLFSSLYFRFQPQRVAAFAAVIAGICYWLISGMGIATTRALIMASLLFGAIYFGRRVLSLRSVTIAAIAILVFTPEVLFHVGFQMSFAATITIIIGLRACQPFLYRRSGFVRWLLGLLLTSFIAGMGTGIVAVYHFNQLPKFGLVANLFAVPMMSFIVLPALVSSAFASVIGLQDIPLKIASLGIDFIINVGDFVGGREDAVWHIPNGNLRAAICLGIALLLMFYSHRLRLLALCFAVFAVVDWRLNQRPDVLIADTARYVGILQDGKRLYSRGTGHGFVYENWQVSDGMPILETRPVHPGFIDADPAVTSLENGWMLYFTTTKKGAETLAGYCPARTIVIAAQMEDEEAGECLLITEKSMRKTGSIAIYLHKDSIEIETALTKPSQPWWDQTRE